MSTREDFTDVVVAVLAAALGLLLLLILGGYATMLFWNYFAPDLFGLPQATHRNGIGIVGFVTVVSPITFSVRKK